MKLSCLPVSYFDSIIRGQMPLQSWIQEASELGLDGIDLSILFFEDRNRTRLREIRRMIGHSGLILAVVNTYSDLTHPESAIRKREIEQLEQDIETAALLGTEHVRIVSGQAHPETSGDQGVEWAVSGFRRAAVAARKSGIQLVYENHSKPGNWQYPDFSLIPDHFLRIAAELKGTAIKILFDTANPIVFGVEALPLLQEVIDEVVCVHAADTRVEGRLEPVVIGTGVVPFVDLFGYLKTSGFSGWISIEEASGKGKPGVQSAVNFVRQSWERS
jgi:sugar phosphate isomerase/epimerase